MVKSGSQTAIKGIAAAACQNCYHDPLGFLGADIIPRRFDGLYSMQGLSFIAGGRGGRFGAAFHALNPVTGEPLEPAFYEVSVAELDRACSAAGLAFEAFHQTSDAARASLLRAIAERIEANDEIVARGMLETGLPQARLEGERARTCGQLRLFASLLEEGSWVGARIDHAQADRKPVPKPDIRSMRRPLGPVAVFCASNFPLAFSVAGGDTASALAAGCPVIVKAHHAHPGLSELVAEMVVASVETCGLPPGVFSLIYGAGRTVGQALVSHPHVQAVGFTGSRSAGQALGKAAAARPQPIPVYAEMSSVNPVFLLPGALQERASEIAAGLHASVTLGVGQFCTNPGLVFLPSGAAAEEFRTKLTELMRATPACPMLHHGIREAYAGGVARSQKSAQVQTLVVSPTDAGPGKSHAGAALFQTSLSAFFEEETLAEEIFGPATLLVMYESHDELHAAIERLEGQLTATVHANESESKEALRVFAALERKAGRVILNGFPTGVEVCHAMVHGGPYPATSDGRSTSVGTLAIERFTRHIAWQNCPDELLPPALQESNPLGIRRLVDGKLQ
jgi:NADP-dependent aldehyde dehydrogenase